MYVSFEVKTQTRRYPVCVGQDLLGEVGHHIGGVADRVFVITDDVISEIHLNPLLNGLNGSDIEAITKILPAGESIKTLETTGALYDFLTENLASRSDTVIALGGGVIGDIAGFVASTYKRGTRLIQVPTTLLAQVDSALGGKTAVNLPDGKNLVGSFYQPHAVVADVCTLTTLSTNEFTAGLSEVIKYGVIMDSELLDILVNSKDEILNRVPGTLALIVERCLRNKARVVEEDEREEGRKREILNFGHTIGHAIEICSDHTVRHGQAVAMGMVEEARLAERMGLLDSESSELLVSMLSMFGLPTEIPSSIDVKELDEIMQQDKKVRHGQLILPVLVELGRTEIKVVESVYNLS
ncbi:MAG: 3-dehydroquinate synthase [Candidatus Thorarchaeota archaeon]